MACYDEIPEGSNRCPRCGFTQYQVIGDADTAMAALKPMAERHRTMFLKKYDLGISVYTWKDQNGSVVRSGVSRQSFGTADRLSDHPTWLNQQFARVPENELTISLSVQHDGLEKTLPVRIPALKESQLQQLGIRINSDLTVTLLLKNQSTQVQSAPVDFL
jgi:hypothetical protein